MLHNLVLFQYRVLFVNEIELIIRRYLLRVSFAVISLDQISMLPNFLERPCHLLTLHGSQHS